MVESAAESPPAGRPQLTASSPPVPKPARRSPSTVWAALLALAMGIAVIVPLAIAWANPVLFPLIAPFVVLTAAVSLWGASKVDAIRLAGEVRRLADENAHLTQNLGWLADTARELRESQQALDDARLKAEAASHAKSRLLATVSHEFRTPLNGILGLTGLLLETDQTPDQITYSRAVHSSGEALLALVDDMLDFSKIEAGRLDLRPTPTDLASLLQEIAELLAARAHAKGIDIAADVAPAVPAVAVDAHRLRQVLLNLAGNGVKFTEHGGVTLAAAIAEPPYEGRVDVAFTITDSGPGVPAEAADRLFREFEQLDPGPARRHGGAGLGLAISRRIVRAMDGEIAVAARPGGGAVFSFTLSLALAQTVSREEAPPVAGSVLVVAPPGAEPSVLAAELGRGGAVARVSGSGYEAAALIGAAAAAGQPYDAVLIDQRTTPDAANVLARLRDAAGGYLPAAVLIEPGRRGDIEALRAAGFDAYLVRPVRRFSLMRIVSEIMAATGNGDFRIDPGDAKPRAPAAPRRPVTGLHVLLAEDNEINALLARAVVEGLGHTVDEVRDGTAAVAAAIGRPGYFSLMLMDLHMPGLDGLSAVRVIRAHERDTGTPRARILAVTADVLTETRTAALAAGVDQVVEKPMTPDALRRALAGVAVGADAA
jgi:signal transduction histidine kinase/CheY-like chemotaxis protein